MKLSVKYFLSFLGVALVPLIVIGLFTFVVARDHLTSQTINSLESLATIQESRINDSVDHDFEQIDLVTSRSRLVDSFQGYVDGSYGEVYEIQKILDDLKESTHTISEISAVWLDGEVVASTNPDKIGKNVSGQEYFEEGKVKNGIHEFFKDDEGKIYKQLSGPFMDEGKVLGVVEVISDAQSLIDIIEGFSAGQTGESLLATHNENGDALFLTSLKFDSDAALNRTTSKSETNAPINAALEGKETTFTDPETEDYRGESVIASTRYIDRQDWGLVVKIDRSEAFASFNVMYNTYIFVLVATFLLVLLASILLSRGILKPIRSLTRFAEKIQQGALNSRVDTKSVGEIDILSLTLNNMADQLDKSHTELEGRVKQRTAELNKTKALDEAMLASIGDGLVVTDLNKKILLANKAAVGLLGYTEEEMIGKDWLKIAGVQTDDGKHPDPKTLPINRVLGKEDFATTSASDPFNFTRKNGAPFSVAITATKLKVDDVATGAIIVFRDITKDRSIDQAKTEFVSLASHQLRTPLSAINWYTEMLKDGDTGKLNKEQLKLLDEIYTGNQRMIDLVNSLLNVSRLELGSFVIEPEPTDLPELAKSVIKDLYPKINNKQHIVSEKYSKLPKLELDQKLTRIILQNLLSNSVKYSPPKSNIELYASTLKKGQPADGRVASKDSILMRVTDNGFGIPAKEQKMIFQKMYRAENVRAMNAEGTGLGVYIIKQIVEQCGGEIWFHSKENEGTTFFVMLPLSGMKARGSGKSLEDDISVTDLQDDNKHNLTKIEKKAGKVIVYDEKSAKPKTSTKKNSKTTKPK